jgi:hypothetical protein
MHRIKEKFLLSLLLMMLSAQASMPVLAFDLEDYATTHRATRDAYARAQNEYKMAVAEHYFNSQAAADADAPVYTAVILDYISQMANVLKGDCGDYSGALAERGRALSLFYNRADEIVGDTTLLSVLSDAREDEATAFRTATNDAVVFNYEVTWNELAGIPDINYHADMITTLRDSAAEVARAGNDLTLAIPPYKAAYAAYLAATTTYTGALRTSQSFVYNRSASVRADVNLSDPLIALPSLPNGLRNLDTFSLSNYAATTVSLGATP